MPNTEELDQLYEYGLKLLESIEADDREQRGQIAQLRRELLEQQAQRRGLLTRLSELLEAEEG